jgi:oxygen-independent coproporphyrinogen-3 oxidase
MRALREEIARHKWVWDPETVYLGGGTPSRIDTGQLADLLTSIPGRPWVEATIEAAPGGITRELAEGWKRAGITRVSLGVQSFVEAELRLTGRKHTADLVEREIGVLRDAGLGNVNVDLIAGLAAQTEESWRESLEWVRRLSPPHVSVYILEVDEDSRLGLEILQEGSRYGAGRVPDEEQAAHCYEIAVDELAGMGLNRYEISNFARPGNESRHNLKYWLLEPYAGFGVDAHAFDGQMRRQNTDDVREYVARLRAGDDAVIETREAFPGERFWVGLRLSRGVHASLEEMERHGKSIARLKSGGLLAQEGNLLRLTARGVLLSNEVFQEFL